MGHTIHLSCELDEEDSCPPDLESVDPVVQQQVDYHQQQQQRTTTQQTSLDQVLFEPDSELLRNLAIAIKAGMEAYQGEGTYEPSADELIDVLKNLENLAAANPALYRAIVDQIKGNQPQHDQRYEEEQTNGHQEMESHMEQGYSEVDQLEQERFHQEQMQMQQQQQQHVQQMNGAPKRSEVDHVAVEQQGPKLSKEEILQMEKEAKMQAEIDKEHEENMRKLREKKRKEKEPPPPPKTITVMAGSRNRPSWPI